MSDDVLSIIPTDPHWQPDQAAGDRAAGLVAKLVPDDSGIGAHVDVTWHKVPTLVDCAENLETITCPLCGAHIDLEWWEDLLDEHEDGSFSTLLTRTPCCSRETTLDALHYNWPCGFAKFEIAVWNPERPWLSNDGLAVVGDALGHPVQQIRAHL
jgi:hypothetical protein